MPALRTELTEIVTGLAMLGDDSLDAALAARPDELVDVDERTWQRLVEARGTPEQVVQDTQREVTRLLPRAS